MRIGLAGYIGAGKTTCAQILAESGIYQISGDQEAKLLIDRDPQIKGQLIDVFGDSILDEIGAISSKKLGTIVFGSVSQMHKLNAIVHPPLIDHLHRLLSEGLSDVVLLDAALIPLWKIDDWFDVRIWVHASFQCRLSRLQAKGIGLTEDELRARMHIQQELFSEPSPHSWVYLDNENGFECFKNAVLDLVHEQMHLKNSI